MSLDSLQFVIYGAPRTKKTSNRIFKKAGSGRPLIMPSEAHQSWFARAKIQLIESRIQRNSALGVKFPIKEPVSIEAHFYRDANRGDAVGYFQALADVLERAKIIENDRNIADWDGSRLHKDSIDPRIVVVVKILKS